MNWFHIETWFSCMQWLQRLKATWRTETWIKSRAHTEDEDIHQTVHTRPLERALPTVLHQLRLWTCDREAEALKVLNGCYASLPFVCVLVCETASWPPNSTSPKHQSVFLSVQPRSRIFSLSSGYFWPAYVSVPVKRSRRLLGGSQCTSP